MRADAQRNRDRILDAARGLVADLGGEATMEDIARRAGVAVGTLYRHFPAKEDLVAAVVDDSMDRIATMSEATLATVEAGARAWPQLADLFRAVAERHTTDMALKEAAGRLDVDAEIAAAAPGSGLVRSMAAIAALLELAKAQGDVRADVTVADLVLMLGSVPGIETPAPMRARFVEIVIAGLGRALT